MRTPELLYFASISAATVFAIDLPFLRRQVATADSVPTSTREPDDYSCQFENISQYIDVPNASDDVFSAIDSYASELLEPCFATATGMDGLFCQPSETSQWCGLSTAIPASLEEAYKSYGSVVASWWMDKSSKAMSVSRACPNNWARLNPLNHIRLNHTIALANCYVEANPDTFPITASQTTTTTALPGMVSNTANLPNPTESSGASSLQGIFKRRGKV